MCGIIAYIGKNDIKTTLLNGLKKLEYRGYDSSGIAVIENNKLQIEKSVGEIKNLEKHLGTKQISSHIGIAHTRWATHGLANKTNAHPHTDQTKTYAVVHNGIFENYQQIKNNLKNVDFYSQTDTEILPNLIAKSTKPDTLHKLIESTSLLVGSYAIALIDKNQTDTIYLAKKQSPLYVAISEDSVYASSDPICFDGKYEKYFTLNDDEFCVAKPNNLTFFNKKGKKIKKIPLNLGIFEKSASHEGYDFFAEKEINETPFVLKKILQTYKQTNYFQKITKQFIDSINKIHLVGCGTAYHSALMGAQYLQKKTGIEATAYIASEYRYFTPKIDNHTLCIFTSQSGETADTLLSLKKAKSKKAKILSIVNVPYSTIARESDIVLPCCAGAEIAVMSTKAYNSLLFVLYLLAKHIKKVQKNYKKPVYLSLNELTKTNFLPDKKTMQKFSDFVFKHKQVFFIGKGEDYITAQEGSLKLKEITYINSIALPSGELKHGTLALVDNETVVIVIATKKKMLDKNLASASEIKSRGGKIVVISQYDLKDEYKKITDLFVKLPSVREDFSSMISVVPLQLLALDICLKKCLNPDKPRNLAKSVTVE